MGNGAAVPVENVTIDASTSYSHALNWFSLKFSAADHDENKKLDATEWNDFVVSIGLKLAEAEAKALFDEADTDKDGFVVWGEMKEAGPQLLSKVIESLGEASIADWIKMTEKKEDQEVVFYYNKRTMESTMTMPEGFPEDSKAETAPEGITAPEPPVEKEEEKTEEKPVENEEEKTEEEPVEPVEKKEEKTEEEPVEKEEEKTETPIVESEEAPEEESKVVVTEPEPVVESTEEPEKEEEVVENEVEAPKEEIVKTPVDVEENGEVPPPTSEEPTTETEEVKEVVTETESPVVTEESEVEAPPPTETTEIVSQPEAPKEVAPVVSAPEAPKEVDSPSEEVAPTDVDAA